jgi:hypothetical protein
MLLTREDLFIKLFLSAYEDGSWSDADMSKCDAIDRQKPAIDMLAARKTDGKVLAVEHTIIEPFIGDKEEDFASFGPAFLALDHDRSLIVKGRWLEVFVPVGALGRQPQAVRDAVVLAVKDWIRANRLTLPEGRGKYPCQVSGICGNPPFDIGLNVRVTPLKRGTADGPGALHVRRQQMDVNLGDVIERALRKKLRKLANTKADKRILLLERQHMNLLPEMMLDEIESRCATFTELSCIDEIWIMETMLYGTAFAGTYLRFELYRDGNVIRSYDFNEGKLIFALEDGWRKVIQHIP